MSVSRIYIAQAVAFLAFLAKTFDIELPYAPEEITDALVTVAAVGAISWTLIERFYKGGITWWGKKVSKKK